MHIDGDHLHVLASGRERVSNLAVDSGHVFWASGDPYQGQAIESMPRTGGGPTTIATAILVFNLTVNGKNLYWNAGESEVDYIPTSGGNVQPIVTGLAEPRGLAFDSTFVYFAMLDDYPQGSVLKAPRGGGPTTELAKGLHLPRSVAVDDSWVYVATWGGAGLNGAVLRLPMHGGEPIPIATNQGSPQDLLVDGGRLYWVTGSAVRAADLTTWDVTTIAAPNAPGLASIALDARYVYVALSGSGDDVKGYTGGTIWRVCKPVP